MGYGRNRSDFGALCLAATLSHLGTAGDRPGRLRRLHGLLQDNDVFTDDRGEPGPGLADVRHGAAVLFDEPDATNGAFCWKSILMPPGALSVSGVADRADSRSRELQTKTFVYAIDGGTGVFKGAKGEMEASTLDGDDRRTLRVTRTCDS